MSRSATQIASPPQDRLLEVLKQIVIIIAASLFVALCAKITIPLPFTTVPLTAQNFAVILVGLLLGSKRGFAALVLYLAEGAAGFPVFNPLGPGGIAQIIGPTGGYLMAYSIVAAAAGFLFERGKKTFAHAVGASIFAEILLFIGGVSWLYVATHSLAKALHLGFYGFTPAEIIKVMFAAAIASAWARRTQQVSQ